MYRRITSWGFSYYTEQNGRLVGGQMGHSGPDLPTEEERKLLRRIRKHVR